MDSNRVGMPGKTRRASGSGYLALMFVLVLALALITLALCLASPSWVAALKLAMRPG